MSTPRPSALSFPSARPLDPAAVPLPTEATPATELPKVSLSQKIVQDISLPDETSESLMKPMIFFSISVAALIFSIMFYCGRSNSTDLISCIFELVGL